MMTDNEIAKIIVDAAYKVQVALGPGLLESVYQRALVYELKKRNLEICAEQPIQVTYDGIHLGEGFRADVIINDMVIVELKSVENIAPVPKKTTTHLSPFSGQTIGITTQFWRSINQRRYNASREPVTRIGSDFAF